MCLRFQPWPLPTTQRCKPRRASRLVPENLAATDRLGVDEEKLRRRDILIRMKPWGATSQPSAFRAWADGRKAAVHRYLPGSPSGSGCPPGGDAGSKIRDRISSLPCVWDRCEERPIRLIRPTLRLAEGLLSTWLVLGHAVEGVSWRYAEHLLHTDIKLNSRWDRSLTTAEAFDTCGRSDHFNRRKACGVHWDGARSGSDNGS